MAHKQAPPAQAYALRLLAEGAEPKLELLADASGRSMAMLQAEAARDGWNLDGAREADIAARVREIAELLLHKVEALGRAILEGGTVDRAEIEAIITLIRSLEKIDEIMRPIAAAKEKQTKENEHLADVLQVLNQRIVRLARALAAEMAAGMGGADRRPDGGRRMDHEGEPAAVPARRRKAGDLAGHRRPGKRQDKARR